jgi:outer membrane lipoprotein LolB
VNKLRLLCLLPCLAFLLGGCATNTGVTGPGNAGFEAHRVAVLGFGDWQLEGRLNIRQQQQSDTVSIRWQQQGDTFEITLSSTMLGLGTTQVSGGNGKVLVEKAGEAPVTLPDLQALTRDYLAFDFPATNLLYWVRGLPAPDLPAATTFDDNDLLASLTQQDSSGQHWQLTFDRYTSVDALVMPGRIRMSNEAVQLTFLVGEWQLH